VKRAIALEDGPTILMGHSYGGVLITEAGNDPNWSRASSIFPLRSARRSTNACRSIRANDLMTRLRRPTLSPNWSAEQKSYQLKSSFERYPRPRRTPALRADGHTEPSGELLSCHRAVAVKSVATMSWFRLTQDEKQKDLELALSLATSHPELFRSGMSITLLIFKSDSASL
jgi:hypothetical protein